MVNEKNIEQKLEEYLQEFEATVEELPNITHEEISSLFILRKLAEIDIMLQNLQEYAQK
jgi:FAD synthase